MLLSILFSAAVSMVLGSQESSAVKPLHFRLGAEGDILAWLTAGPYPNDGALQLKGTGFKTDYLQGEDTSNPKEGDRASGHEWRLAAGTVLKGIDLKGLFHWDEPGIGYCFANIVSPTYQSARLLFGSDDGAKVFLNGEQIFSKQVARGIKRDEEKVPIHLRKGVNRLLFKIEQGDGDWGLMARIVDAHGLVESLSIQPTVTDGLRQARAFAGSEGGFDVESWSEYFRIHALSSTLAAHLGDRIHDAEKLSEALHSAENSVSGAHDNLDHFNAALQHHTANLKRQYAASRQPLVDWAQHPGPFLDAEPAHGDWIRVLSGGRYFSHADGKPFIPIGANHNPDWPELEQANPLRADFDPQRTDRWFQRLVDHGVNVIRLMVETPPSGNLEQPVGTINPEHLIWLDNIVGAAHRHGVRLWITPYDTFWMSLRKDASPYWQANGGPIANPIDFLTKRSIIDLQKRRIKFLIDRYGNSDTIFAWEIMNEIDLWWGASPEQIRTWVDEVAPEIRKYERQKWGRNHMLTISFAKAEPEGINADTAFRQPEFDFATMHLYLGASRGTNPGQEDQAAADFAAGVTYAREQVRDNRPVLDGESGPIDHWIKEEGFDDLVFHRMSWAHLLAGGAGPGTRWPYRQPHHITNGMLETLKSMSAFCADVPWDLLTGATHAVPLSLGQSAHSATLTTDRGGLVWATSAGDAGLGRLSLPTFNRAMRYRVFDVRKGSWLTEVRRVHASESAVVTLPKGVREVAVWMGKG